MKSSRKLEVPERHKPEQLAQKQTEQLDAINAQLSEINTKLNEVLKNQEGNKNA